MRITTLFLLASVLSILISCEPKDTITEGVSLELAQQRSQNIKQLTYELSFDIPSDMSLGISGKEKINFSWKKASTDLILDFTAKEGSIVSLTLNGEQCDYRHENGHLIISADKPIIGSNVLEIDFVSSDLALNRNEDFLYTLFVPDRASSAFPCFDQPDLKANYTLNLSIPKSWLAISNAKSLSEEVVSGKKVIQFEKTAKISTYHFSFVAGRFERITKRVEGIEMNMLHRENDEELMQSNQNEIFNLNAQSIKWMEEYTGIDYPFSKLDFVLLPGFQFGGMEHVGAIQYRSDRLILDESASLQQKIDRTSLIAHEVAHMWFGNLVTMEWFDDVWMKEVFANFMADKIVKEQFPNLNHNINFMLAHYPDAYSVDRTAGANPIKQPLDNLKNAGSLYGDIIYHKAPIAMKQLEIMIGENSLRQGLRDYLESYSYKNASWEDLVEILDRITTHDLSAWSDAWVKKAGRPLVSISYIDTPLGSQFTIEQLDKSGGGNVWQQAWNVTFDYQGGPVAYSVFMDEQQFIIPKTNRNDQPSFIQMNSNGLGYGMFYQGLDYVKGEFIFSKSRVDISNIKNDLQRAAAFLNLHEFLLEKGFHPQLYYSFLEIYIAAEKNDIILGYLLDNIDVVYNRFFTAEMKIQNAANLESVLWKKLLEVGSSQTKSTLLESYIKLTSTETGVNRLKKLWEGTEIPDGLVLSKSQKEKLALNIAFKGTADDMKYFEQQMDSTTNTDKLAKLQFIKPVFSKDVKVRDAFFDSLKAASNRTHEPWVLTALNFIHHPSRNEASVQYLSASLELLEEIQTTGSIFFPKRWLDASLSGYNSKEANNIVQSYLDSHQDLNPQLRMKLLQSADMLFRAEENLEYYKNL